MFTWSIGRAMWCSITKSYLPPFCLASGVFGDLIIDYADVHLSILNLCPILLSGQQKHSLRNDQIVSIKINILLTISIGKDLLTTIYSEQIQATQSLLVHNYT